MKRYEDTETFTRPNGKPYRPRKPGELVIDEWANDFSPCECGAVVLGTLDPYRAAPVAREFCDKRFGISEVTTPRAGWWRLVPRNGDRLWIEDAEHGRPGVMFTAVYPDEQPWTGDR